MVRLPKISQSEGTLAYSIELTSMEVVDELENIRYTTYGVRACDEQGNVFFAAPDVNTDKDYVARFLTLCVENEAEPIHLLDLLEDYLD